MSQNTSGLHEWATSYTGQQKVIGAFVVGVLVLIVWPPTRKWGAVALAALFVVGVAINLIAPGTINGNRVAP